MTLTAIEQARPQWWTRLLTRAGKDPSSVLKDRRWTKPELCRDFFDLCNDMALQQPKKAPRYAQAALELAEKIDDRHLIHSALGVLVHACIARSRRSDAAALLEEYRPSAFSCCKACRGEWLWRHGDLLAESRDPTARAELDRSRRELGDDAEGDASGRLRFVSGIAYHNEGDREQAIDEAGNSLLEMSFITPRGYFMDGIAFIACFLQRGSERQHVAERHLVEKALAYLKRFGERLEGVRGWSDVRIRLAWVQGQLHALLGDTKSAYRCLDRTTKALRKTSPVRHWFAANIDLLQLYAKRNNDLNLCAIKTILRRCRQNKDLDPLMRRRLKQARMVANSSPANARNVFVWLRASFIVPVPGLIEEPG